MRQRINGEMMSSMLIQKMMSEQLSSKQLAEALQISESHLCNILYGRITSMTNYTLSKIARYLGVQWQDMTNTTAEGGQPNG